MTESAPNPRSRWLIVVLIAIFAAPPVVSWVLFKYTEVGRGAAPRGDLIQPPRLLPDVELDAAGGGGRLHGQWTMFYLAPADCPSSCEEALYRMQQVRIALGTNAERARRVLAFPAGDAPLARLAENWPGQSFIVNFAGLDAFRLKAGDDPLAAGRMYLVDPRGYLMMSYERDADPQGIISDLKRLVRYSRG